MGITAGAAGLGIGLAGLFGAGPTANNAPPQFQMPNMGGAANNAYSGIGGLTALNTYGAELPQAGSVTTSLVNNPYAGGYQTGANTAGQMGQTAGLGAFGAGNQLYGTGTSILGTAFDPQQALYNQTLAQVTGEQNVNNANAGVGTSPYGAGLTDMNIGNFNIDWQNQQLNRQTQGLSAADTAFSNAANLQSGGAGTFLQGAGVPYSTFGQIGQGQLGALNQYGQFGSSAAQIPQSQIQDYLAYLGQGSQQQQVNNQTAALGFNENLSNLSGIGYGLGALGAGTGTGWTNYFAGNPYGTPTAAAASNYNNAYSSFGIPG